VRLSGSTLTMIDPAVSGGAGVWLHINRRARVGRPGHPIPRSLPLLFSSSVSTLQDQPGPFRILIRDRGSKFTRDFDVVYASEGIRVVKTPVQAPETKAIAERFVGDVRPECLRGAREWAPSSEGQSSSCKRSSKEEGTRCEWLSQNPREGLTNTSRAPSSGASSIPGGSTYGAGQLLGRVRTFEGDQQCVA
jgi:hypothetical protein